MANIDFDDIRTAVLTARRRARSGDRFQRIRTMLLAAGLAAVTVVGVAGVFLARLV